MRSPNKPINGPGSLFLHDQFRASSSKLFADFVSTRRIAHRGTQGSVREAFTKAFLRRYIPRRFELGSGVSIDSTGKQSGQIDIAVFDTWFAPTLLTSEDQHLIPIENLYAVIEVKSRLDTAGIAQAAGQLKAIRKLKRVYYDAEKGFTTIQADVVSCLFAFDGPQLKSIVSALEECYVRTPARDQIHSVYVLGKGVVVRGAAEGLTPFKSSSRKWCALPESFDGEYYREWNGLAWTFLNLVEHLTLVADRRPRFSIDPYIPG